MKGRILAVIGLSLVGCKGIHRLVDGPEGPTIPSPSVLTDLPPLASEPPEFNVPMPPNTTRLVFHDALALSGEVQVQADTSSFVCVFMRQRTIGQWIKLGPQVSEAFWYSFDAKAGIVTIHGTHLDSIEFCIYQYIPE